MGKPDGFLLYERQEAPKRPVLQRLRDYDEVEQRLPGHRLAIQAARCMDCGIPTCHTFGCPLRNLAPDWNDMVYRQQWRRALLLLHATNNLPEVTGRVCPAPCESACTLAIGHQPVTIRQIELQIAERGWDRGWVRPEPPALKTGRRVAIVGSGPAGLAAAQQLARAGHEPVVFEKADRPGGILRYGIPDFKLPKWVIDRRLDQMRAEGVSFETRAEVGTDLSARYLRRTFDAVLIAAGARQPRDLDVPGRGLEGIHFAMPFLAQQNRRNAGLHVPPDQAIRAEGKDVVVIGGGDTGADCVGTARRQGARRIVQLELLPRPPESRTPWNPWPTWPQVLRHSTSHDEGCERRWSVQTREAVGDAQGRVAKLRCVKLDWEQGEGGAPRSFSPVPGSEFEVEAQLVLLAMGFLRVEHGPLVEDLELATDERGNLRVDPAFMTSTEGVFAAGDSVLGASLVVRAIELGRRAAAAVDAWLRRD
ncbi:MAG: glutamate synthase subunit beta [Candidatus Brocadiia bacterium]